MATFLDVGFFSYFGLVFAWIFIFALVYAVLKKTNILGADDGINAIIALCVSVGVLFMRPAVDLILITIPWFIVMIIVIFFGMTIFMALGVEENTLMGQAKAGGALTWTILVAFLLIVGIGSVAVFGDDVGPQQNQAVTQQPANEVMQTTTVVTESGQTVTVTSANQDVESGTKFTLFHPKILGVIMLLLIAFFTMNQLEPAAGGGGKKE